MPRLQSTLLTLFVAVAMTTGGSGAPDSNESLTVRVRERMLRMTEFFDTMLPGVLDERNMTLHFRPKFGDLRDSEFMRFPLELRYGYSDQLELSTGLIPFTPNPFNQGRDHRWGVGEARFGARYDVGSAIDFFDDTTFGLETRIPLGHPPVEVNDHYTHIRPSISAARRLRAWPDTTFYANVGYDHTINLTNRDRPPAIVVRRNIFEVSPGLLYKPSELGYFAEYRFRHFHEPLETRLGHEVQFGTIWDVPLSRSERWNLPGKWQLELAYKVTVEEGRDTDHGIRARVRWRTTLREVLNHAKSASLW